MLHCRSWFVTVLLFANYHTEGGIFRFCDFCGVDHFSLCYCPASLEYRTLVWEIFHI